MLFVIAGVLGILLGIFVHFTIPAVLSAYVGVAILAGLDSIFGGFVAIINKKFSNKIFATGLLGNAILAVFLVYIGNLIGLDLTLAAIVAFGVRIFGNLATMRRFALDVLEKKWQKNKSLKLEQKETNT